MNVGRYLRGEDRHVGTARTTQFQQPQRTWVGMTDEDFLEACQIAERGNYLVAFQRIQAKLRSKNESKN